MSHNVPSNPDHPDCIDLRSDTITQPTPAMLEAMTRAPLGDDVLGDEPTVLELERRVATMMGHEAAMFVPSGTMGNLCSILTLTHQGDAAICEAGSHVYVYEAGGLSAIGGVLVQPLKGERGFLDPEMVASNVRRGNYHFATTRLLCLENTHNTAGGTCLELDHFEALCEVARNFDLSIHLDGARLWNASVATGIPFQSFTKKVDTVSCCFSKGLSAPVGSIVCSSAERIQLARRKRKMLGGGMRQSGVLAAAALVALDTMIERLVEDHARAKALAETIQSLEKFSVCLKDVQTNIIRVDVSRCGCPASEIVAQLAECKVRCLAVNPTSIRLVTNRHFTDEKLERTQRALITVHQRFESSAKKPPISG